MKSLLTSTVLGLALVGSAAMANPQLENAVQNTFDRYNVPLEASNLTDEQLAEVQTIDLNNMDSAASIQARLMAVAD